jgi:DNA-binding NarL/FixJ family response regulator
VAVLDLNMPGLSGVEVTRRLVERAPASRVLMVSMSVQEEDVTAALLAGASGYVLKESPVEEVVAGIEAVAAGESLISPRIASMLLYKVRHEAQAAGPPTHSLSRRSSTCCNWWPTAKPTTRSPRRCTSAPAPFATTCPASS